MLTVTSILNAGFQLRPAAGPVVWIDPLLSAPEAPALFRAPEARADLILISHAHWDHFDADGICAVSNACGCPIAGPDAVTRRLEGRVEAGCLIRLEPAEGRRPPATARAQAAGVRIEAFRTYHSRGHNSLLLEIPDRDRTWRLFFDGDNEDTRPLSREALGDLDALFLGGPWQGSDWAAFVERLAPRRWFLMHLTAEELEQHGSGQYLPDLCERVPLPGRLTALHPGESVALG